MGPEQAVESMRIAVVVIAEKRAGIFLRMAGLACESKATTPAI